MTAPLFGLPSDVRFCKLCTISNQRPSSCVEFAHTIDTPKKTIPFDAEGICGACRVAQMKKKIDWADRERQLRDLCDQYRSNDGSYDCIVPGSGGKDSFAQAIILKERYGMHPLSVTWRPGVFTPIGFKNHTNWIDYGLDNYLMSPNGKVHRLLTKLAVRNLLHVFQMFIIGQSGLAPKMAKLFNIKLIFYGESTSEYQGEKDDLTSARRGYEYFTKNSNDSIFLGGVSLDELYKKHKLTKNDLAIYLPSDPQEIMDAGIDVRHLGYYIKWHPQEMFYLASDHGFQCNPDGRTEGTYSKYSGLDDVLDMHHFYMTLIKFGIGRATYDSSQEIRSGDITREDGVALVKHFDQEYPARFNDQFLSYIDMSQSEFDDLCDKFRSPHLWNGRQLRHNVWDDCTQDANGIWKQH